MPYDDPDPTDPMTLHGVELETDGPEAAREMAACFIEEYVRLGLGADAIFELFSDGRFAGPAMAMRQLGDEAIAGLIQAQFSRRGTRARALSIEQVPGGTVRLPVLDV